MFGKTAGSDCDPHTIIHGHHKKHSLLCGHHAYYDDHRNKVIYIHDDEVHENCGDGYTHHAKVCLAHKFTKVAGPDEDCSQRDDCHLHVRDDGVAELHHPVEEGAKKKQCQVVAEFRPIT